MAELQLASIKRWRIGLSILFSLMMAMYCGYSEWGFRRNLSRALAWPIIQGKISDASSRKNCSKDTKFTPLIVYSYTFSGVGYDGGVAIFKDLPCADELMMSGILKRFPVGATIPVHVNPVAPGESVVYIDWKYL